MWILLSLLSAFFYAAATMFTKYSVSKVIRDQKGIVLIHAVAAQLLITILWILMGRESLASTQDVILAIISGALIGFAAIFYFKAFNMEDASVVTLLTQIIVPMTMIAGIVVLGDSVNWIQVLAAAIILAGVVISAWSRKGFHLQTTDVIPVIVIATIITTALLIISKSVLDRNGTIAFAFHQTIGNVIFGILITLFVPSIRKGFKKNMKPFHAKTLLTILTCEFLYVIAVLTQFKAFTYVNAGLVIAVGASEVFIAILLGLLLTKFLPHIIREKVDRRTIGRKIIAGILIVSGIVILNFVS